MFEITSASISWINVSMNNPRVYRLPSENAFSIATSSDNYEDGPDIVFSSETWLNQHANALNEQFYAAVDLTKEANGKFKLTLNHSSRNFIFDYRDSGPASQNAARQCNYTCIQLEDGDVFELGINSHLWTSLGDAGLGTFQIRYEFDNQPPTEKVSPVNNTARLDTLPSEVLMNIFGNLPIEDVVLNLPCVCNKFFELLKTRVTRRNLNVHIASNTTFQRKPYFFPCEMGLIAQLVLGNAVESISLTVYKHVDRINFPSHLLSFIGRKCKFVSIRYYAGVEVFNSLEKSDCFEKVLWRISTFSKVLTFVYIWPYYSFNGLNSGSDWPVLPSVKNLSIQFNSEREVMKAQHLSEKFPNLERFCYDDHKPRSAAGLCSELGNQGRTIPWKALSVKKYPDSFAWNLFQDLQTLELTPSENFFSDEFFEQCVLDFEKNRHLKHLFLHFPEYFSEGQVLNFVDTFPVNLEVLILDFGSFQIEDYQANIIERLVTRCPKLETLYLKFFSSINPFNIMRIYESLPNLRRLIVNDVEQHETNCCISWIPQTVQGSLQLIRGPAMDDLNELFFW